MKRMSIPARLPRLAPVAGWNALSTFVATLVAASAGLPRLFARRGPRAER